MRWKLVATAVRQMQFRPQPPAGKWLPCFLALPRPPLQEFEKESGLPHFPRGRERRTPKSKTLAFHLEKSARRFFTRN